MIVKKYFNRQKAPIYLLLSIVLLGVSIFGFSRDLKTPLQISTVSELNNNLGNKVEFTANKVTDTGIEVEVAKSNSTGSTYTTYHFYLTQFDSENIVLVSNDLKQTENVKITGIVANLNSSVGSAGQAYEYFRKNSGISANKYNAYGVSVLSDNILILDIVFAVAALAMLLISILSFKRK